MSLTVNQEQPLSDYHFFVGVTEHLELKDIGRFAQVSWKHNDWVKTNSIWRRFSELEGIPSVVRAEPQPGDARMDFMTLRTRMISKVFYDQYLGEMIEAVPPISKKDFNRLKDVNPFDKEHRMLYDTFKVLVDPTLLRRTGNVATLQPLLENSSVDLQGALMIPLTLKNLKVLCDHPLKGAENGPIFGFCESSVLDHCNICPDKINVSFISEHVAEETRSNRYPIQVKLLRERGFNVASLRHCILRNAAPILISGTCADDDCTYARNSDLIDDENRIWYPIIGGFAPSKGVDVESYNDFADEGIAVVPCIPAEVLPVIGT